LFCADVAHVGDAKIFQDPEGLLPGVTCCIFVACRLVGITKQVKSNRLAVTVSKF